VTSTRSQRRFPPGIRWHDSGTDWTAGTLDGIPAVLGYRSVDDHVAESTLPADDRRSFVRGVVDALTGAADAVFGAVLSIRWAGR
jgi:hypothetical protein